MAAESSPLSFCGFDWPCRVQPDPSFFAVGLPMARVEHDGS
jgi:hypothetical protein